MVTCDQGVTTQGEQSLKHAPSFWGNWSRGRSRCRAKSWSRELQIPPSYLPHTQNSSDWTDTLEFSGCMNLKLHQCIMSLETLQFAPHVLEGWICRMHKVKLRKMCVCVRESWWDSCGGYSAWIPQGFHTCVLVYFIFFSPCGITDGVCG